MKLIKITPENLKNVVSDCFSWADVMRKLDVANTGGAMKKAQILCAEHQINVSHFKGRGWAKIKKVDINIAGNRRLWKAFWLKIALSIQCI